MNCLVPFFWFKVFLRASVMNLLASRVEKFSTEAAAQQYKLH